jgi:hypothetical protein
MARTAEAIIDAAAELLRDAKFGLEDMKTRPGRAKTGLRNAVVFGRNTTWALQNLKNIAPDFEAWYAEKQAEMRADPLMRYFGALRNAIEKQANTPTATAVHIQRLSMATDMRRFQPAPPNAKALVIGDQQGGTAWIVPMPDGSEEKYYVELPPDIGEVSLHLPEAPRLPSGSSKAEDLVAAYLDKIEALVAEARRKFAA